jgi:class 3 adenylate cyclase
VGAILFADVVEFSRLRSDLEVGRFLEEFLGRVAAVIDAADDRPLARNTWGDGLYLVFSTIRSAGICALSLNEMVARTAWSAYDLPSDLGIRIALHAGPLFAFVDPVTRQPTWSGRHVTRAARMEPITPPGAVYASREFAALTGAYGVTEFQCDPVGRVTLAKREGFASLFVVHRSAPASGVRR